MKSSPARPAGKTYPTARLLALGVASSMLLASQAHGQVREWDELGNGSWTDASRWIGGGAPNSTTQVRISKDTINAVDGSSGALLLGYDPNATGSLSIVAIESCFCPFNYEEGGADFFSHGKVSIGFGTDSLSSASIMGAADSDAPWANWRIYDDLYVGDNGTGTLTISKDAIVSNQVGRIGFAGTATGTVNVNGLNSFFKATWDNSDDLYIGFSGTGTLNVNDYGTTLSRNGFLGWNTGSNGTATIDGDLATWTNTGDLSIGYRGTGTLNIRNGGAVTNAGDGVIGAIASSTGGVLVTGTDSSWENSANLYVGKSSAATLDITSGGSVYVGDAAKAGGTAGRLTVSDYNSGGSSGGHLYVRNGSTLNNASVAILGDHANEFGYATVNNATWANGSDLLIGSFGTGELTIENGGVVSNSTGFIGHTGTGMATVTGTGSTWTNTQTLYIGNSGTGSLDIKNGGQVSNSRSFLGVGRFSTGMVTVDGSGSSWDSTSVVYVGYSGSGTLAITDGGQVSSQYAYIGSQFGSNGTVTVDGSGSSWEITSQIYVGGHNYGSFGFGDPRGTGTLNIEGGGQVINNGSAYIASRGATGTATVDGSGSSWESKINLYVGYVGTGTGTGTLDITNNGSVYVGDAAKVGGLSSGLTVSDSDIGGSNGGNLYVQYGSTLTNALAALGDDAGEYGYATVSGTGSTWTNTSNLFVGNEGTGSLAIDNGGQVTSSRGYLGLFDDSSGTVTVDGTGSSWMIGSLLYVGDSGTGTLGITDGGQVKNTTSLIGDDDGSIGTVTVNGIGSSWEHTGLIFVGNSGTGSLAIENGGQVTSNGSAYIGSNSGSTGTATVDGSGSSWESKTDLYVGNNGTGTLDITSGGSVYVGDAAKAGGAAGWLTVSDSDNADGTGTGGHLYIQNGSTLTNELGAILGDAVGEYGYATVNNATWTNGSSLYVGYRGTGSLTIDNGGQVSNSAGFIGFLNPLSSTVTVDGSGSSWENTSSLIVGYTGTATLAIQNGGQVSSFVSTIARFSGSIGTVTVDGLGSAWTLTGNLYVGGDIVSAGGTGTLDATSDGLVDAVDLIIWNTGTVNLNGGTIDAATIDHTDGGAFNFTDGTLIVDSFLGSLTQAGGSLAPGNSPGTTTVTGDYNLNAGGIEIELAGLTAGTEHDEVIVSGALNLGATSELEVVFIDGFVASNGDTFDILDFSSVTGTFDTLNLASLDAGLSWDTSNLYTTGEIGVVPEPTSLALLALGGLLLTRRRRSR